MGPKIKARPSKDRKDKDKDKESEASGDEMENMHDPEPQTQSQDDFTSKLATALQSKVIKDHYVSIYQEHYDRFLKPSLLEEVQQQLNPVIQQVEGLSMDLDTKTNVNSKEIKKMSKKHDEVKARLLSLERSQKACNLILIGLPDFPHAPNTPENEVENEAGKQDEATASSTAIISSSSTEMRYISRIYEVLSQAGMQDIAQEHICSASIIKIPGQPQRILFRLNSIKSKINIFKQKKLLKSLPFRVYLNEDLTKEDGRIYKKSREQVKDGLIFSTWTKGGIVFAKKSENSKPFEVLDI
jgi:hypothetical protein